MSQNLIKGTITAIVTPFKKDLSIDYDKFKSLIDFQINNGVDGIVVCGSTGESATLSAKEKLSLFITAVEHINGRIPVIAGTGSNNTTDSLDMTLIAKEQGVDAALIVAPYYNKPTQDGLYNHFATIAEKVDLPLIIYNVPSRSVVNIRPETQLKLAKNYSNIIATKEASGNLDQMCEIIKNSPPHFTLLSGDDSLTFPAICLGAKGVISVISNYLPKEFSEMVNLALIGKIKESRELHYKMLELMSVNFIESNPAPVKAILNKISLIDNNLRLPLVPVSSASMKVISDVMKNSGLFK